MNITITDKAANFMRRMIRFNGGAAGAGFRLVVSNGGCSGFNSSFSVETAPLEGDTVLDSGGVKIFLPTDSVITLQGVTVDFADSAMSTGLSFTNPNADPCACKTSAAPPKAVTVSIASIQRKH